MIFSPHSKANNMVDDSFYAFLVEGASFTKTEEYPILPKTMISTVVPAKILPFSKAITSRDDLHDTFICFFSPDKTFERIRRNPRKYLSFFQRTAGIIGFDFSIHDDMPIIKQKSQINDNLSLTYFFGTNGIPVIPNLRCGIDELLPEFLQAISPHSIVAVGTHGFCRSTEERCEWYCFLETIIQHLAPSTIIVYGTLNDPLFDDLKAQTNFVFFEPWISQRYREVHENVDKGCK